MQTIAAIGPEKVALLNTESGEIDTGKESNQKFILSQDSLKELNLIKEGTFVETEGAPAFVVKGEFEIEVEELEKFIEVAAPTLIKESEIYKSFFSGICEHPTVMLEQILLNQSHYAPIFFFINKANLNSLQAIDFIEQFNNKEALKLNKKKLLDRIKKPDSFPQGTLITDIKHQYSDGIDFDALVEEVKIALNLTSKRIELQIARTIFYNTLLNTASIPPKVYTTHLQRILEAMSNLPKAFIIRNKDYILNESTKAFDTERDNNQSYLMRRVISNIDTALFFKEDLDDSTV